MVLNSLGSLSMLQLVCMALVGIDPSVALLKEGCSFLESSAELECGLMKKPSCAAGSTLKRLNNSLAACSVETYALRALVSIYHPTYVKNYPGRRWLLAKNLLIKLINCLKYENHVIGLSWAN